MFRQLFELSADAILLLEPCQGIFIDCNQAAVEMMHAHSREQLLLAHPADVSPEFQPDGRSSVEKTQEMTAKTLALGSYRFDWLCRRFDGTQLHVEVLGTTVRAGENPLVAVVCRDITDRKQAEAALRESEGRFRMLFERSADAMSLLDPQTGRFIEANEAAARQTGAPNKRALSNLTPADISPPLQPDGSNSIEKAEKMVKLTLEQGSHHFEWMSRCFDGRELPLDVVMTAIPSGNSLLIFLIARDISNHTRAKKEILELNASLEKHVAARTAELVLANEQLRESERELRTRNSLVQKHRDVLLDLARAPKSDRNSALADICFRSASTLDVARVSYWALEDNDRAISCELMHCHEEMRTESGLGNVRVCATDCPSYFEALATRRPIVASDVRTHPATIGLVESYLEPLGITSMLDAPVWVRGEVVGVLCHEHIGQARVWSAEEIDFVSALATMVSLALEESRRAKSEHFLRESEQKFRSLFEASSQGVILHDEEKMLEVNPACLRILGFPTSDDMVGKHPAEISAPVQPSGESAQLMARRHIQDCLSHGHTRFEWLARNSRDENIPIEVILTRIEWEGRKLIQAVFNDIAARKKTEAELQESAARLHESEARFSAAFRSSPIFMTVSNLEDGKYVLANEAFLKWTGYRLDEVLGRNSLELALWADPLDRAPFLEELHRTRSIRDRECRVCNRHGKVFTTLLSADIIEIHRKPHLLTVGLDITQRKQAEEKLLESEARLRESETRFRAAFRASPIFITISRLGDCKFVLANEAFLKWSDFRLDEVLGRDALQLSLWANPADRESFYEELRRVGCIRERECCKRNRHGKIFTMLLSADIIEINRVPHLLTFGLDITQRKQAEAELLKTLAREKELGVLRSRFVSMVSHEFRTPLGIIQSSAEILDDYFERLTAGERKDHLQSVQKNTRRMAALMEELLLIGSLEAEKLEFRPTPLNLTNLARSLVDEIHSVTSRRCPIQLTLGDALDQAQGDERLLRHMLANLLTNAVKYSEVDAPISFQIERNGRNVIFVIRDQGIGIPEVDREWLFKAFHRGQNVGERPGTGLGLAIVQRCVTLQGGRIQVESTPGAGTTMTACLPMFGLECAQGVRPVLTSDLARL